MKIPPAYYFKGTDSTAENRITLRVGDYNDSSFEQEVQITAEFMAETNWEKLLEFYNRHSLNFILRYPVVEPERKT